jgi:hypothetical protein
MADFWRTSGFHLLQRDGAGWLRVTDAYLHAYMLRPEIRPMPESCPAELALHEALRNDPSRRVGEDDIAALADPAARDNWRHLVNFRDRLLDAGTIEACYLTLFRTGPVLLPPLFIDQMTHVILRNALDGCDDPFLARAGELFFRGQKATLSDGAVMLADEETVEFHRSGAGFGTLGRLIADSAMPLAAVELDVLTAGNATLYWERSDRYDMVLDVSFGRRGLDSLCRVIAAWVRHFFSVEVSVQPVMHIRDRHWCWHVGLDAESSAILNDLYHGAEIAEDRMRRLLSLFRLEFRDPAAMRSDVAGRPVYLGLAMDGENRMRLKPQNLLVNLPLAAPA